MNVPQMIYERIEELKFRLSTRRIWSFSFVLS
jgi:hypothetical protein